MKCGDNKHTIVCFLSHIGYFFNNNKNNALLIDKAFITVWKL